MAMLLSGENRERPVIPGAPLFAAIDIGTVTCRLLVAQVDPQGRICECLRDQEICDLGEGVDHARRLSDAAIERVGRAVERFMAQVRGLEQRTGRPIPVMAVATSASRDAENAGEFRERLAKVGVDLAVISGREEAALSFAGASSLPGLAGQNVIVVDSGGGSTEVIAGLAGEQPFLSHSFDVGCRRLTDRFFRHDPPLSVELQQAREWAADEMAPFFDRLEAAGCLGGPLVAVAGTATSCVAMVKAMEVYDPAQVHGAKISRSQLDALLDRLAKMPLDQRRKTVGLQPRRAGVIVGGLLILQVVMDLAGKEGFVASETDSLHGMIARMRQRDTPNGTLP